MRRMSDRYRRVGLSECVVIRMSGPPPGVTQEEDTRLVPGQKLKLLTPPGIVPGLLDWKAGTQTTTLRRRTSLEYAVLKSSNFDN